MIYVIGIGPGGIDQITPRALEAMKSCFLIAGYEKYVGLVKDYFPDKAFYTSGMRSERERCEFVLWFARMFKKDAALISSGDSGVYGMAGLMLETAQGSGVEVRVIPGIPAANSCAALLGAPLMNDYVTISLSDLMTTWKVITQRLIAACRGDFVICIYNPASHHRPDNFKKACGILLERKPATTPAGWVRNAGRKDQEAHITTLGEIMNEPKIDMLCTIIIGNSQSYIIDGQIITPRGYNISDSNRKE